MRTETGCDIRKSETNTANLCPCKSLALLTTAINHIR